MELKMKQSLARASCLLVLEEQVRSFSHLFKQIGPELIWLILIALAGAPLSGWVSDKVVAKYRRKRGYWYPEDRLRASLFGFFLPIAVFAPAVITEYVPGTLGLVMNLLCFLINGIAVRSTLCLLQINLC